VITLTVKKLIEILSEYPSDLLIETVWTSTDCSESSQEPLDENQLEVENEKLVIYCD